MFDTIVSVKVGKEKQEFFVHKGLICHYSTYFKNAFTGEFQEGHTGVVELANDSVAVFKAFYSWTYIRKLFEPVSEVGKVPLTSEILTRLYVFGDARGIPSLKNASINALIDKIANEWNIPTPSIPYIYDNTPESCHLRKLAVDMVIFTGYTGAQLKALKLNHHYTTDFLKDLAAALLDITWGRPTMTRDTWRKRDRCQYHDHSDAPAAKTT